jgi:hypothetical protein
MLPRLEEWKGAIGDIEICFEVCKGDSRTWVQWSGPSEIELIPGVDRPSISVTDLHRAKSLMPLLGHTA